jgi:FtsZ-interacting cell division protein ZipA
MAGNNNNDKRAVVCSNPSCQKKWVQGQPMFKFCSQCGQAKYCSKECQRAHWKQHKRSCKKKAQQIQQQQEQSQQSIKSPQLNQKQNQNNNKKQQQQQNPGSPQLKQSKNKQSPQLHHQSQKARSPSPSKRNTEKETKSDSNDPKKLANEIAALKKEKQEYLLNKEEARFFLEQTKKTIVNQNNKMESFTERLRLTLNKVKTIHESLNTVKAMC